MITANSRQRTANSRQRTANSRQQTADSKQQTANSGQQTADSKQQKADSRRQEQEARAGGRQQSSCPLLAVRCSLLRWLTKVVAEQDAERNRGTVAHGWEEVELSHRFK